MKIKSYSIIRAKFPAICIGGGRCKPGDLIVMFPRNIYIGLKPDGTKDFMNTYARLNDVHKIPQLAGLHERIMREYGIDSRTYGSTKRYVRK